MSARGHRRLPVGDPAVVGRQPLGHEHSQPRRRERRRGALEQQPVLEHAAREHDDVDAVALRAPQARLGRRARDGVVEARRRRSADRHACVDVAHDRQHRLARIEHRAPPAGSG